MQLANPSKALILLCALISVTLLMALNKITPEAGLPVITAFGGYGLGNGIGAASNQKSPKIFEPKDKTE